MTERQFNNITAWQKQTFGQATPLSKLEHLKEEIEELYVELLKNSPDKRLEFADCFFLLFGAAAADGMTYQDICKAIEEKYNINKARTWGEPDKNGVVKHIK
jgi:NTP pyrophosphatase (non-canonical NTP hydrolase)